MKMMRASERKAGYTLLELVVVLSILVILILAAAPHVSGMMESARRAAATEEAQSAADAVRWYLAEKEEEGELKTKDIFPLIGLELDRPGNVLEPYLGAGKAQCRIETVTVNLNEGRLMQLTFQNPDVRVRLTWDEDGNLKTEYPDSAL